MNKLQIVLSGILKNNPTFVLGYFEKQPNIRVGAWYVSYTRNNHFGYQWYGYGCRYNGGAYYVKSCDFAHQEFHP